MNLTIHQKMMQLHRAHSMAVFMAGKRQRAVMLVPDGESFLPEDAAVILLCTRHANCATCARIVASLDVSYLEMGLVHKVAPPSTPLEPQVLAEEARV